MKILSKLFMFLVLAVCCTGSQTEAKNRKLPLSAYIKSAKISILPGKIERYPEAIAMLDSLFLYYGPHAEGLSLMSQINVDYIEKASSPADKLPYVETMVAYFDSLKMCCENDEINKKYKKNCESFMDVADSTKVKYWREFYNLGIEQLSALEEAAKEIKLETDSTALAYMKNSLNANIDSCVANMKLAVLVDPNDFRSYVAIGNVYEQREDYEKSIEWYGKGLEMTEDSSTLLISIAYDYINLEDFCGAIPFFKYYIALPDNSDDVTNMGNLAACYINCKFLDSAKQVYQQIIEVDTQNTAAMVSVGQFFNDRASDASSRASDTDDEKLKKELLAERNDMFDSALAYFSNAVEVEPENAKAVEQVALVNAIRGNYEPAAAAFEILVELKPGQSDLYTSLGDCHLYLQNFEQATRAYEKVVELVPDDLPIWENLAALYKELHNPAKEKEALAIVKKLKGN